MSSNPNASHNIAAALDSVHQTLAKAARAPHREPSSVTLIAVSKTHDREAIEAALAAGQRHFGENRVQEAQGKFPSLKSAHPDLVLHLVGPLQTNKVRAAVELFDAIHTLDRRNLAEKLAEEIPKQARPVSCFVQVNTGREPQKAGIDPAEAEGFVALCRDALKLQVVGLMCIPPAHDEPSPHFAFLRELAKRCGLSQLSMGMSGDAEIAVRLGATHVRIGTAIFGTRKSFNALES